MNKGFGLCIGVNEVDNQNYPLWLPRLQVCEKDALSIKNLLNSRGFHVKTLLTVKATFQLVKETIKAIAKEASKGDIVIIYYSGHGSQMADKNDDEQDNYDETWCLYDKQLIDDELTKLWIEFSYGVRIFLLSDSCHSGTIAEKQNVKNQKDGKKITIHEMSASLIQISACQDFQLAKPGFSNSLFTNRLLKVWNNGDYSGNYCDFYETIKLRCPKSQKPSLVTIGTNIQDFLSCKPFTI